MGLKRFLKRTYKKPSYFGFKSLMRYSGVRRIEISTPRMSIICRDGFSFSAQGNGQVHSVPRRSARRFYSLEVYHVPYPEPLLGYEIGCTQQDLGHPNGEVPVKDIQACIRKHGGIDWKAMRKQNRAEHWRRRQVISNRKKRAEIVAKIKASGMLDLQNPAYSIEPLAR